MNHCYYAFVVDVHEETELFTLHVAPVDRRIYFGTRAVTDLMLDSLTYLRAVKPVDRCLGANVALLFRGDMYRPYEN